jgi:hypothetical protein
MKNVQDSKAFDGNADDGTKFVVMKITLQR